MYTYIYIYIYLPLVYTHTVIYIYIHIHLLAYKYVQKMHFGHHVPFYTYEPPSTALKPTHLVD